MSKEPDDNEHLNIEGEINSENDTALNSNAEMEDITKTDDLLESNDKLLGVTTPGISITPVENFAPDIPADVTEEPMDIDTSNDPTVAR